jgi:hypothetical protein
MTRTPSQRQADALIGAPAEPPTSGKRQRESVAGESDRDGTETTRPALTASQRQARYLQTGVDR